MTTTSPRRTILPFTAIVGQETMKKALLVNAVNPRIGGVLIWGGEGDRKVHGRPDPCRGDPAGGADQAAQPPVD